MATPQETARLEQIKRTWQQKRQITDRLSKIATKIGVYSGKGGVGENHRGSEPGGYPGPTG